MKSPITPSPFQAIWHARTPRERTLILIALPILALILGFVGIYEPMQARVQKLEQQLPILRAETRQMRVQAAEIERLRAAQKPDAPLDLAQRISGIAQQFHIHEALLLEPLDTHQTHAKLQGIPVETWLAWQSELARSGIRAQSATLHMENRPGFVSVDTLLVQLAF